MAHGYMGKLLNVNLATGSMEEESLDEELCRDYIGGYGLGAKLLYDRIPVGADPLGPDNVLALLTGPLTGTPAVIGSRFVAMAKSPKTSGGLGDANCGGFFGPYLNVVSIYKTLEYIPAAKTALFRSLQPVFIMGATVMILKTFPGIKETIGGIIIISGNILLFYCNADKLGDVRNFIRSLRE